MKINLDGKLAVIAGSDGAIARMLGDALAQNGATILRANDPGSFDAEDAFLLVNVSRGAETLPQEDAGDNTELEAFAGLSRRLAPRLARVVNVFSAAGLVPIRGLARFSAAQAGLASLTRTLAMEFGPALRVNAVAVGAHGEINARLLSHTALRRPATPEEIAVAALFLADPDNGYMTGHTLTVDGGWAAGYARNF